MIGKLKLVSLWYKKNIFFKRKTQTPYHYDKYSLDYHCANDMFKKDNYSFLVYFKTTTLRAKRITFEHYSSSFSYSSSMSTHNNYTSSVFWKYSCHACISYAEQYNLNWSVIFDIDIILYAWRKEIVENFIQLTLFLKVTIPEWLWLFKGVKEQ